ncbi:hypothetical protein FSC05_05955 [Acinetobacter indicus]|nr:hypothetical protein FSC05_05955 [Acinetobacter indicus]RVT35503.1 hypothetical protein ENC20_06080 [Acinetobacter indicus]
MVDVGLIEGLQGFNIFYTDDMLFLNTSHTSSRFFIIVIMRSAPLNTSKKRAQNVADLKIM